MELLSKTDPRRKENNPDVSKPIEAKNWKTDSATSRQLLRMSTALQPEEAGTEESEKRSIDLTTREATFQLTSKYSTFCSCGERQCSCSHHLTVWERTLPRNAIYWPKLKIIIMVCLGSIPWLFFLTYIIVYFL